MNLPRRFQSLAHRHALWDLWRDFLLLAATSISNAVDKRGSVWQDREDQYLAVAKKYSRDEMNEFVAMLGDLTVALEEPGDILGQTYMALELGNKWAGQFFTPDSVCQAMARIHVDDRFRQTIGERRFVTANDPAIGGGATVIGLFAAMRDAKLNPQTQLHVTGVDVDIKSVHMAYIQLSLLGVPAVIVHGNTLTMEQWSHWYTPMHILRGWNAKLTEPEKSAPEPLIIQPVQIGLFGKEEAA